MSESFRSSSNRQAGHIHAWVANQHDRLSPARLPRKETIQFMDQFNQTYKNLGLSFVMSISAGDLIKRKCLPCEGGVPILPADMARHYTDAVSGWSLAEDAKSISKKMTTKNFVKAMELVNQIAEVAEEEQHHPDLHLTGYRNLKIVLATHAIGGLSENDFIVAAKIDQLVVS